MASREDDVPINQIDHVNIRTSRFEETIVFYADVLAMKAMPLPGAADITEAAWLCDAAGRPAIHLSSLTTRFPVGDMPEVSGEGSGKVHHVAFECSDYDAMLAGLRACNQQVDLNDVPQIALRQIFVRDPNGILVELNFR